MEVASTIEVIAPSSKGAFKEKAREAFEARGLKVNIPDDLMTEGSPYEANTVAYKVAHLIQASNDERILAMIALRGGYGSTKVAEEIVRLPEFLQKKFIVGYSDLTALFTALNVKHGWLCVHGPVICQAAEKINPKCIDQVIDIVTGKISSLSIPGLIPLNDVAPRGELSGKLIGGNICVFQSTIGTAWQPSCNNKILFLEDWNEPGYKVDRMLTHLRQSGILEGVEAVVLGQFLPPKYELEVEPAEAVDIINFALSNFAKSMKCPVYKTEAFGHGYENTPLVIGADAQILVGSDGATLSYSWEYTLTA